MARRLLLLWLLSFRSAGSVVVANGLSWNGWHVESSRTTDQTCVPCIGRQILMHCTAGEVL